MPVGGGRYRSSVAEEPQPPRRQVPEGAIVAATRVVGPARVLAGAANVLMWVALVAGAAISAALLAAAWGEGVAIAAALVIAAVLLAPSWWLRHARSTFRDVIALPDRLRTINDGTSPFTVSKSDLAPSSLRTGGIRRAVRTVRTTISEVSDFLSPASTVLEVVAPPFWLWTAVAAGAAIVLLAAAPLVLLVLALT